MYDCKEKNFTWVNSKISFDHVGQAYLALFQVVSSTFWYTYICFLNYLDTDNVVNYVFFLLLIVCALLFTAVKINWGVHWWIGRSVDLSRIIGPNWLRMNSPELLSAYLNLAQHLLIAHPAKRPATIIILILEISRYFLLLKIKI